MRDEVAQYDEIEMVGYSLSVSAITGQLGRLGTLPNRKRTPMLSDVVPGTSSQATWIEWRCLATALRSAAPGNAES